MHASRIAEAIKGRLIGEDTNLRGVASLFDAASCDLSVIIWPKDIQRAKLSKAGCIVAMVDVVADYADQFSASLIVVESLYDVFVSLKGLLEREEIRGPLNAAQTGVAPDAKIHPSAIIVDASIGRKTSIGAHAVIYEGASIGDECVIGAGAVIHSSVSIGHRSTIGANCVIGGEGFVPHGINPSVNLWSLGSVSIGNDVRIGALCTIDRGLLGSTRIGDHTLIDNMVHVGHDSVVERNVIIAAQSGLAGNVRVGDDVTCGGQVGIAPHVVVDEGARLSGKTFVHCDVKKHEIWSGNPGVPHSAYLRAYGRLMRDFKKGMA